MKNIITIILVGLLVELAYNTCEADSTVVVSKKHKRVLKVETTDNKVSKSREQIYLFPTKVDTFIDNDGDGINDLLKKDDKNTLFRFLDKKASYYVKEKNAETEKSDTAKYKTDTPEQKENTKPPDEKKKIPSKKTVKVKKVQRR